MIARAHGVFVFPCQGTSAPSKPHIINQKNSAICPRAIHKVPWQGEGKVGDIGARDASVMRIIFPEYSRTDR